MVRLKWRVGSDLVLALVYTKLHHFFTSRYYFTEFSFIHKNNKMIRNSYKVHIKHVIMLKKLYYYGFRDKTYLWFTNYLTNRTQYISVRDFKPPCKEILCGVPQGSVLGPIHN